MAMCSRSVFFCLFPMRDSPGTAGQHKLGEDFCQKNVALRFHRVSI